MRAATDIGANPEQIRALAARGHCVVIAGPGSGKTRVLTQRLRLLLETRVRAPRGVACLSYNNECVSEIQDRLKEMDVNLNNAFVGTVHSFCLRHILGPFRSLAGTDLPEKYEIASSEKVQAAKKYAKEIAKLGRDDDFDELRRVAIDRHDGVDGWDAKSKLALAISEYETKLRSDGLIDFDDAIRHSAFLLENNEFARKSIAAKFPHLLIDEYQDLGVALHRIALAMAFRSSAKLFAVGDPDQSIYKFAGSRPRLLREVAAMNEVETVELRVNYRSARRVVMASRAVLGQTGGPEPISAEAGSVRIISFAGSFEQQCDRLASTLIPDEIGAGVPAGDIAILYPSRNEGPGVVESLERARIPSIQLDRGSGYSRTPLVGFIKDAISWCSGGWRLDPGRLGALLGRWNQLAPSQDREGRREVRALLCSYLFAKRDSTLLVTEWIDGFRTEVLGRIRSGATTLPDLGSLNELSAAGAARQLRLPDLARPDRSPNHVKLMNLHTSKGTEHSVVFIVGCEEGRIPHYKKTRADDIAEQRRLLFVGISRAKRKLILMYSRKKELNFGMINVFPSRFLADIVKAMSAEIETKSY